MKYHFPLALLLLCAAPAAAATDSTCVALADIRPGAGGVVALCAAWARSDAAPQPVDRPCPTCERLGELQPGTRLRVHCAVDVNVADPSGTLRPMSAADVVVGRFVRCDAEGLTLHTGSALYTYPCETVGRVETRRIAARAGRRVGAVVGALVGGVLGATFHLRGGNLATRALLGLYCGAAGAGIGFTAGSLLATPLETWEPVSP